MALLQQIKQRKFAFFLLTNKSFRLFRRLGVFVTPVHFYNPIPDVREVEQDVGFWERMSELPGVEMNDSTQLHFMQEVFPMYHGETDFLRQPGRLPYDYHTQNVYFGYVSAVAMHSMIRHFRPRTVVEVGAGNSTYVIAQATRLNTGDGDSAEVIAIDPYPNATLRAGVPGVTRLVESRVQSVPLETFTTLRAHDILSIDTSHSARTGGDVNFLYLEVLPCLAPGVLIHIHDIFLPAEYPETWLRQRYFWNEQYLLHAFLVYNHQFEILWGQKYAELRHPEVFSQAFSGRTSEAENHCSYSFWLRRKLT